LGQAQAKTPGEVLFETYLSEQDLPFEFEIRHTGKRKRPDYRIKHDGQELLLDVKDFAPKDFPEHGVFYDPIGPIRNKIDDAEEKFQEFKSHSCSLVLHNEGAPLVHLSDPLIVFGAMFGNPGYTIPMDTGTGAPAGPISAGFLEGGKLIHSRKRRPRMEHISALLTVRRFNVGALRMDRYVEGLPKNPELTSSERAITLLEHLEAADLPFDQGEQAVCIIVWENTFAARPLPIDLFCGEFDERWTLGESGCTLSFRGSELEKIAGPSRRGTFFGGS
jgi:hypothetical protein